MPAKRVLMKKIKRILELRFVFKLSIRAIARNVGVSRGSVSRILERATVANLTWPLPDGMTDAELEAILYPSRPGLRRRSDLCRTELRSNWN